MSRLLLAAWERLSLYLPVLLMGVLALGTYWLVRSTPVFSPAQPAQVPVHEPDYFMKDFAVRTFDASGALKSEVFGTDARHYPDTRTLEIDQVRIRSFDDGGRLTTASALRALTNDDATDVQLIGKALVVREEIVDSSGKNMPRIEFKGEFLHVFMNTERLTSNRPVELVRGQSRFTADAIDFDNQSRVVLLTGRVRGTLVPGVDP